jgi:hypothetical protein
VLCPAFFQSLVSGKGGLVDVIDLAKFARELPEGFKEVRRLIARVTDLNSSRTDLRLAADVAAHSLRLLRDPPAQRSQEFEDTLIALTSSGIIYYARATKSSSKHRRTFDLRSHFYEEEIE